MENGFSVNFCAFDWTLVCQRFIFCLFHVLYRNCPRESTNSSCHNVWKNSFNRKWFRKWGCETSSRHHFDGRQFFVNCESSERRAGDVREYQETARLHNAPFIPRSLAYYYQLLFWISAGHHCASGWILLHLNAKIFVFLIILIAKWLFCQILFIDLGTEILPGVSMAKEKPEADSKFLTWNESFYCFVFQ